MDVRKINTKGRIQEGLLSLLYEKSFALCSVSDIIITAQVSKRSFYSYYENKFELLQKIEDQLIAGLKDALETDWNDLNAVKSKYSEDKVDNLVDLEFDDTINKYCDEHKKSFSRLLSSNGDISFINRLEQVDVDEITKRLPYFSMVLRQ